MTTIKNIELSISFAELISHVKALACTPTGHEMCDAIASNNLQALLAAVQGWLQTVAVNTQFEPTAPNALQPLNELVAGIQGFTLGTVVAMSTDSYLEAIEELSKFKWDTFSVVGSVVSNDVKEMHKLCGAEVMGMRDDLVPENLRGTGQTVDIQFQVGKGGTGPIIKTVAEAILLDRYHTLSGGSDDGTTTH